MKNRVRLAALLSACALGAVSTAWAAPPPLSTKDHEAAFDAKIDPAEMGGWLKLLAAEPNHVGSPHDKANALQRDSDALLLLLAESGEAGRKIISRLARNSDHAALVGVFVLPVTASSTVQVPTVGLDHADDVPNLH